MTVVLDTNAVIYLQKGQLAEPLPWGNYSVSVITEMELLSYAGLDEPQLIWLRRFLADTGVVPLDDGVKERAIVFRREHRLKLPDAIVAASASVSEAVLLTNDEKLLSLPGLKVRKLRLRDAGSSQQ